MSVTEFLDCGSPCEAGGGAVPLRAGVAIVAAWALAADTVWLAAAGAVGVSALWVAVTRQDRLQHCAHLPPRVGTRCPALAEGSFGGQRFDHVHHLVAQRRETGHLRVKFGKGDQVVDVAQA
jgi:hypothetical protein